MVNYNVTMKKSELDELVRQANQRGYDLGQEIALCAIEKTIHLGSEPDAMWEVRYPALFKAVVKLQKYYRHVFVTKEPSSGFMEDCGGFHER